ncbi:MAG: HDOD domain-containing protein [Phycisphaeraceae bacterium]|nr:HDOD domain-containing protein [Phycisphaeraceae bacterium]MCW5761615.1 HDOD domain-containing protein [Phycisphaeraceae bacterium]
MSATVEQREQVVSAAIREISHIATLPEITLKIIDLVEDPKSTAQDLNGVISNDPALCSRILKVVNSSFYGLPGQIGSINRAIVMLGLNAVKNIAIAASLAKLFRGGDLTPSFSARHLWNHANMTAAGAKMIADTLRLGLGDEAYLAGLMHDIGIMVEMQFDRNALIEVVQAMGPGADGAPVADMLKVEAEIFGADHQDFGQALCKKWKFPETFVRVTGYHHRPLELAAQIRTIATVVHVADRLVGDFKDGFRLDLPSLEVGPDVLDALKMTSEQLADVRSRLAEAVTTIDLSM